MPGVLLDTHALYWLVSGEKALLDDALVAIGQNQAAGTLLVSPISGWELSIAAKKLPGAGKPNLGSGPPSRWFSQAVRATAAKVVPIRQRISCEAANVASMTGPGIPAIAS